MRSMVVIFRVDSHADVDLPLLVENYDEQFGQVAKDVVAKWQRSNAEYIPFVLDGLTKAGYTVSHIDYTELALNL